MNKEDWPEGINPECYGHLRMSFYGTCSLGTKGCMRKHAQPTAETKPTPPDYDESYEKDCTGPGSVPYGETSEAPPAFAGAGAIRMGEAMFAGPPDPLPGQATAPKQGYSLSEDMLQAPRKPEPYPRNSFGGCLCPACLNGRGVCMNVQRSSEARKWPPGVHPLGDRCEQYLRGNMPCSCPPPPIPEAVHLECAGCGVWCPGADKPDAWTEHDGRHYCYECSEKRARAQRTGQALVCALCGAPAKKAEDGNYRHLNEPFKDASTFCEKYGYPIPVKTVQRTEQTEAPDAELKTDPLLEAIYNVVSSANTDANDITTVSSDALRALVLAVDNVHAEENAAGIEQHTEQATSAKDLPWPQGDPTQWDDKSYDGLRNIAANAQKRMLAAEARVKELETAGEAVANLQPASHAANQAESDKWATFYRALGKKYDSSRPSSTPPCRGCNGTKLQNGKLCICGIDPNHFFCSVDGCSYIRNHQGDCSFTDIARREEERLVKEKPDVKAMLEKEAHCFIEDWKIPNISAQRLGKLLFHAWCMGNNAKKADAQLDDATLEACARVVESLRWPDNELDAGRELLNSGFHTAAQSIRFLGGEHGEGADETRKRILEGAGLLAKKSETAIEISEVHALIEKAAKSHEELAYNFPSARTHVHPDNLKADALRRWAQVFLPKAKP